MLVFVSHSDNSEGQHNNKATESVAQEQAHMNSVLKDQNDFIAFLKGSGVPLKQTWTPQQCSQAALAWLVDQNDVIRTQFAVTVAELQDNTPVMQPEVKEALSILLDN
ncbi:hypothetical protein SAMN03080615_00122 [Amphritea atlantica]|uniref:Uncharacterized protein n=2 Tax=Amphritea TaxID=515417 RepID=A0A1H9CR82_9GAMM|nr:hypothetical protein [Amphritea atlantica]SEQ03736.1 hypothetical protein SAMN03080615_00122 [Amphritea atlantica]